MLQRIRGRQHARQPPPQSNHVRHELCDRLYALGALAHLAKPCMACVRCSGAGPTAARDLLMPARCITVRPCAPMQLHILHGLPASFQPRGV
jgi:hypothetical protein